MTRSGVRLLVLHGPNLNLLGVREPAIYGRTSLAEINRAIRERAARLGAAVTIRQTNNEGKLVEWIQQADSRFHAVVINPAAYTHTSVALRDVISAVAVPVVEVHLSNPAAREPFRRHSFVAEVAAGQISGFGMHSYLLGLEAACTLVQGRTGKGGPASSRQVNRQPGRRRKTS